MSESINLYPCICIWLLTQGYLGEVLNQSDW